MNLVEVAELVTSETGIAFRVLGFDTGAGLPPVQGFKEHPEIWSGGDFPMVSRDALVQRTRGRAELVLGDIARHRRCVHRLADAILASRFRVHRRRHLLGRPKRPTQSSRSVGEASSGLESLLRRRGVLLRQRVVWRIGSHPRVQRDNEFRKIGPDRSIIANSACGMACAHVRLPCARSRGALTSLRPYADDHSGSRQVHERVASLLTVIGSSGFTLVNVP